MTTAPSWTRAVAGTTLDDGQLTLAADVDGLEELGRAADLQGTHPTWLTSFTGEEPPPNGFLLQTSTYEPELGLALAGVYGPAEQTTLDGRPALLIRPRLVSAPQSLVLTWTTASGHVVLLVGQMDEDELRRFASGLRSVDRETWNAELSPHDAHPED